MFFSDNILKMTQYVISVTLLLAVSFMKKGNKTYHKETHLTLNIDKSASKRHNSHL